MELNKVNWNELRDRAYQNAVVHGLTKMCRLDHDLMMIITELGEAVNAHRKGCHARRSDFEKSIDCSSPVSNEYWMSCYEVYIKDNVEDELTDALIRMLTFSYQWKEPFDTYLNEHFLVRAVNLMNRKKHFTSQVFSIVENVKISGDMDTAFLRLVALCKYLKIDLLWHIEQKMKYNEIRPYMHGKKY